MAVPLQTRSRRVIVDIVEDSRGMKAKKENKIVSAMSPLFFLYLYYGGHGSMKILLITIKLNGEEHGR